ncbi:hypothetical protein EYV94_10320 [Puteibacter caeruleilacunae]|nr:hypothetical protein EYV94_10320 [Puteibacter caeruleilacunae]
MCDLDNTSNGTDTYEDIIQREFQRKTQAIVDMVHHTLKEKEWSVEQLAKAIEESPTDVFSWLSGFRDLTLSEITKMETALDIDLTHCRPAPNEPSYYVDTAKKRKFTSEIKKFKKTHDMTKRWEQRWLTKYLLLIDFFKETGHVNHPTHTQPYKTMGFWVSWNRKKHAAKKLDPGKKKLLSLLGFDFQPHQERPWEEMYAKLMDFKKEYGHTRVPKYYLDSSLYTWLLNQRRLYWKGKLETKKFKRLQKLHVDMKHQTLNLWQDKYDQLVEFKEQHGHLLVCEAYGASKQLMGFVQRQRRKKDSLSEERIQMLDEIGFDWDLDKHALSIETKRVKGYQQWFVRFEELKAYKIKKGTSYISSKSKTHYSMGTWIQKQKQHYKKGMLTDEQIEYLKKIDFFKDNNMTMKIGT